jgi:N-acetylmuramoyl-L-alanine amidase
MLLIPNWTYLGPPDSNFSGSMQGFMGLVLHIAEGSYQGTINWQKNPVSDVSSHTVHGKDGQRAQMLDINLTAWTQANGNGWWVSVEHEGFSTEALTPQQFESTSQMYAWLVQNKGVPLQITDSPSVPGLGWHGMGGAAWGGHTGCPGEQIKAQRTAILGRAAEIIGGDMTTPADVWGYGLVNPNDGATNPASIYAVYADYYAWLSAIWSWQSKHLLLGLAAMADPIQVPALPPKFGNYPETQAFSVPNALAQAVLAAGGGGSALVPHVHTMTDTGPAVEDN